MGGGGQYPFPKQVWSPSGGWWSRPHNWVSNTVICAAGIGLITYGVWNVSAEKEYRHIAPTKPIPSRFWSKNAMEIGVRDEKF